jgi:WD40 repeat protein
VRVWDLQSWAESHRLEWVPTDGEPGVNELAAWPAPAGGGGGDEGEVRVVGGFNDGRIRVWDPARAEPECTLEAHIGPVYSVLVVPAAAAAEGALGLFSASQDIRAWSVGPVCEPTNEPGPA